MDIAKSDHTWNNPVANSEEAEIAQAWHELFDSNESSQAKLEDEIGQVWYQTLELPSSYEVGKETSFFSIGGDSIRSIKSIALLEKKFDVKLDANFGYLYPTIKDQIKFFSERNPNIELPKDEIELLVRDLVADCLSIPRVELSVTEQLAPKEDYWSKIVWLIKGVFGPIELSNSMQLEASVRKLATYLKERVFSMSVDKYGCTIFPLMNFQETLYYHSKGFVRNEPSGLSCYLICKIPFLGKFNLDLYNQAFQHLIATHSMLRTVIDEEQDIPCFKTWKKVPQFQTIFEDISQLSAAEQVSFLAKKDQEDHDHRFDLTKYPLFYARAYKLADDHFELVIHIDHQLTDGFSLFQLVQQLFQIYDQLCQGIKPALDLPKRTFGEYAIVEKLREKTPDYQKALDLALSMFTDIPAKIALPYKKSFDANEQVRFCTHHTYIDGEVMAVLIKISDHHDDISLNSLLLACYFKLMYVWTNQTDLIVNMPIYNRHHHFPEAREVVGSFLDIFPVRIQLALGDSLMDIARKCEKFARTLLQYPVSSIDLTRLVTERENLKQGSLSNIIFSNCIGMVPRGFADSLVNMKLGAPIIHSGAPGTVLDLVFHTWEGEWFFDWNYITNLLDEDQVKTMASQYQKMLQQLAEVYTVTGTVDNYLGNDLLPITYQQLFQAINQTEQSYPITTIHEWIAAQVKVSPDQIALTFEGNQLTYRELDEASNQLAQVLRELGIDKNKFVALVHSRSIDLVVAQLGILKAGGAYVPIDPNYPAQRIAYMLRDSEAKVVITQYAYMGLINQVRSEDSNHVVIITDKDLTNVTSGLGLRCLGRGEIARYSTQSLPNYSTSEDLMYMIYTSGSTGEPKGVMVRHRNACNFLYYVQQAFHIRATERIALLTSYSFDMTITSNWVPFLSGASLHILSEEKAKNIEQLLYFLKDERITFLNITPSHFSLLVNTLDILGTPIALEPYMTIMLGAELVNPNDLNVWLSHYPTHRFINEYGPTETTVASTFFPIPVNEENRVVLSTIPIGKPIYNTQVYILNEDKELCMVGVPGTLFIGGAGVTSGYLNKVEKTGAAFIPNPLTNDPSDVVYNTGDLAKFDKDGNIVFLGRKDHQVNLHGFRIELGEIEAALTTFDGVAEVCAALQGDNSAQQALIAFYTSSLKEELSHKEMAAYLVKKVPIHMVPFAYQRLDRIPINTNGKLDRGMLPKVKFSASTSMRGLKVNYVAPRSVEEAKVIDVWEQVLAITSLGIHENFWEIGGDSIKSIRLIQKMKEAGYRHIRIRDIFTSPTVAQMLDTLEERLQSKGVENPNIVTLKKVSEPSYTLFCLPYAAGNPGMYRQLAGYFPDDCQVISAQYPGHGDSRNLLDSIEAYADLYVDFLRGIDTPLFILGYSFGGYVAYDLCKKLVQNGKQMQGLIQVGTTPPNVKDELMSLLTADMETVMASYIQKNLIDKSLLQGLTDEEIRIYAELLKADTDAMVRYVFSKQPLQVNALFLTGTEEEDPIIRNEKDKWSAYVQTCVYKEVPGGHLLIKDYAQELAGAIQLYVKDCLAGVEECH